VAGLLDGLGEAAVGLDHLAAVEVHLLEKLGGAFRGFHVLSFIASGGASGYQMAVSQVFSKR
jgi:hypothetical protein